MGGGGTTLGTEASSRDQVASTAGNVGNAGVLPWMTKRSLEEQHQIQDKLVDKEFMSRK